MRGLVAVVIAVAACSDGGVVIVVDPMDPAIAHVRLYVGQGNPQRPLYLQTASTAATAVPANADKVFGPTYWARDPNNSSDFVAVTSPNSVSFTYVDAGQHGIPAIIAVGYDVNFTPISEGFLTVPTIDDNNDFVVYHLPLHGVSPQLDGVSMRQLGLWSTDETTPIEDADCAGLVVDVPGFQTKAFIVTEGDEDCDGYATGSPEECDPDAYKSARDATTDEMSCLFEHVDQANNVVACSLGGPSCSDGQPRDMNACNSTKYCVPFDVCAACPTGGNTLDCAAGTAAGSPAMPSTITSYTCKVAFMPNGDVCPDPIVLERPPTGGFNCNSARIRAVGDKFDDHVQFGSNGNQLTFDLKLDEGCNLTFQPSGKKPATLVGDAVVALQLDNGNGLGVPIAFVDAGAAGCAIGAAPPCQARPSLYSTPLTQCMGRWEPPTLLPPTATNVELSEPSLADDMSELYFASGTDIVMSTRDPITNNWNPATTIFGPFANEAYVSAPNITPDGKAIYFIGTDSSGQNSVWTATRASETSPWGTPSLVIVPNPLTVTEMSPDATQTHFVIAFTSGTTSSHLAELVKSAVGTFVLSSINLSLVNPMNETAPYLTPDGLHLYFAADALITDDPTAGFELYVASRNAITDPFVHAVRLSELSSTATEDAPWVSRDGHTMYFVSRRSGLPQIYVTHR